MGGKKGYKHTEEAKQKIRIASLNIKHTTETKEKLSIAHLGKKMSKESIQKSIKTKKENGSYEKTGKKLSELLKGRHLSPKTEFKKGNIPLAGFKKGDTPWNYIDGKWKSRNRNRKKTILEWCKSNNIYKVPRGCLIHHINQNPLDNNFKNLQLMDKKFHNKLHNEFIKINKFKEIV